jgi:hypothetical protein
MKTEKKITVPKEKFILDACCGGRMMWFDKNHPNALYIDIRKEKFPPSPKWRKDFEVKPDIVMDFRKMNFPDKSFKLVVFDPPHLIKLGLNAHFRKIFGGLNPDSWESDLKRGFNECWRVLEDYGVLIFKWNDFDVPLKKILEIIEKTPLFGQTNSARKSVTYWLCFMKIPDSEKVIL